jgi:hypothetical protein
VIHVAGRRYSNGDIYVGQWKMNKRHGQVIAGHLCISILSDWCYQCNVCVFASRVKFLQGKMEFANGDCYEGLWQDDIMHVITSLFSGSGFYIMRNHAPHSSSRARPLKLLLA